MFSSRFHWDLAPNRLARLLAEKRRLGARILDLTESNPTRAGFTYPSQIAEALADPRGLLYDPQPAGLLAAREAVCRYYADSAYHVTPDRVLLTASTSEAYAYLFKLLADAGDEVLVPRPSYPLFEFLASMESLRVVSYPLVYHGGWSVDCEALAAALTPRTRAIVLVNPNNPTGSFLKREEARFLAELCAPRRIALISDEVFADYAFAEDPRRVRWLVDIEEAPAFSMSGLSKVAGLPQMKLGWIVIAGPAPARAETREKLELIADTYLSVSTPVQHAAARLLELGKGIREQIAARVRDNLDWFRCAIGAESPCRMLAAEGGWYATLQVPRTRREEDWVLALLDEEDVLAQPGFFYDFESEAFLVLSLLTEPETFREGCCRLLAKVDGSVKLHND
ncbi:MAG TPA: pyridoxal phosphate-dependent aminotransferase [Bryobacteraceae bacterium]|nr:pyridoxal phosphate-dependent aminotransferase [Bryobacteraceae bacterium]